MKEGRDLEFSNWDGRKKGRKEKMSNLKEFERKKEKRKRSNLQIWKEERKRCRIWNDGTKERRDLEFTNLE